MSEDERFDTPDGDIILRALGPPSRDFRVHKLVLSLASPVFKNMFSLPQPTSEKSSMATVVEVTDPPKALDIILRLIYPFTPPSFDGDVDTLVECLIIADKYEIEGAKARLRHLLARLIDTHPLRVYAIASRFGFANIVDTASHHILSNVHLLRVPELPDEFEYVAATAYHKLVRHHARYLEVVVEVIKQTPLKSMCYDCRGKSSAEEIFRLRLANLIITGTPVEAQACFRDWVKAYGRNADCEEDCVQKFILSAISRVHKGPPQKKRAPQKDA